MIFDDLIIDQSILRSFMKIREHAEKFYLEREPILTNFNFDISSATYRVLRSKKNRPSIIIKSWIKSVLHSGEFFDDVVQIKNKEDFNNFHEKYTEFLSKYWQEKENSELSIAYKYKIIDLFLKSLINRELYNNQINEKLKQYCNPPLDSITFQALDKITSGKFGLKGKTTGYIKDKKMYNDIQSIIEFICGMVEMPKIYFEYYSQQLQRLKIR